MIIQPWVNLIAGLWALLSSFSAILLSPLNFIITGLVMAVFGFWRPFKSWQGFVNGCLGVWLLFSAFIPFLRTAGNMAVVGLAVVVFSIWRIVDTVAPKRTPLSSR
ncbi:MAG: hypothetical protein FWE57_07655 [Chitinispirillia bacterium]|nr:hypothetical protein [Chitinispirillia bacterium]